MNGMGPGIWIPERDEQGRITSFGIVVEPCKNEPPETAEERERSDRHVPWVHGMACWVFDDGKTLLCGPCGRARRDEEARVARLNRLPPAHREWLEKRGVRDWNPPRTRYGGVVK